jgi:hypothetical protein
VTGKRNSGLHSGHGLHHGHDAALVDFPTRMAESLSARARAAGTATIFLPATALKAALATLPDDADVVEVDTAELRVTRAIRTIDLEDVLARLERTSLR